MLSWNPGKEIVEHAIGAGITAVELLD